jgi:predicted small secreted protein
MFTMTTRISLAAAVACGLVLTACATMGGKGSAKTGHALVQAARHCKPEIMAQKNKAKATSTHPKAVPSAVLATGKTIVPPRANYAALESWDIEGIDLDGNGKIDTGLASYDSSTNTLYVWWSDAMDLGGDGDIETYDGFFWIDGSTVGVILDLRVGGEDEVIACLDQTHSWSGSIVAASNGNAEVMALDATYKK